MSKEKFIMAGDCALRISDSGSNDSGAEQIAIVLLHGYLESLDIWDSFVDMLFPRYRVVTIDLPGHGISEIKGETHSMEFLADTVFAAMEAIGLKKYFIVGHSMGGYVALEFLRRHAGALQGLILLHSTPNPDTEAKLEQREREIALIKAGKKELLARTSPQGGFAEGNRKRFADKIEELYEQIVLTEDEGVVAILRGMVARVDTNDVLRAASAPQLFVFGRKDEYIAAEVAAKITSDHPQASVAWLEESGHMGFIEEPQACADIITDFVSKHTNG